MSTGSVTVVQPKKEAPGNPVPATEDVKPESLIDKHSSFSGSYRSTHNLRVEGTVEGQINCQGTLTIAEQATVKAEVMAQNVTVAGQLDGEVTCPGRFQILPTGRVLGKVIAGTLDIRAGAVYEGALSMHGHDERTGKETKVTAERIAPVMPSALPRPSLKVIGESQPVVSMASSTNGQAG